MLKIMIVGNPRSGTTLLQQLISGYSNVYTTKETHYFNMIHPKNKKDISSNYLNWKERHIKTFKILEEPPYTSVPRTQKESIENFLEIMNYNSIKNQKEIWVEKTPTHLSKVKYIEKHTQEIKYLHLIRNPNDVVSSIFDVGQKHPKRWRNFSTNKYPRIVVILRTCLFVQLNIMRTLSYKNKEHHYIVSYEKLVKKPEEELENILEFLELEYNTETIKNMVSNIGSSVGISEGEKWKNGYGDKIHINRNKKFVELFTEFEQKLIDFLIGPIKIKVKNWL